MVGRPKGLFELAEARKASNTLPPGFKPGRLFAAGMSSNVLVSFVRSVEQINKSLQGSNTRLIGTIVDRTQRNLDMSILRPAEVGVREGSDPKSNRMTGKFRGAFKGVTGQRVTDQGNEIGFGFPDIKYADQRTKGIWRVLEFGLGTRQGRSQTGMSSALGESLVGRFGSPGRAMLPAGFSFTGPNPSSSNLKIIKGPAVDRGAVYYHQVTGKKRRRYVRTKKRVDPKGIYGKFFITRAIEETIGDARREYTRAVTEAFRKR